MTRSYQRYQTEQLTTVYGFRRVSLQMVSRYFRKPFRTGFSSRTVGDDDDELMLNVLRCHLTY